MKWKCGKTQYQEFFRMQIFIERKNVINIEMHDNTLFFTWQNKILKGCLYVIPHNSIKTFNGIVLGMAEYGRQILHLI